MLSTPVKTIGHTDKVRRLFADMSKDGAMVTMEGFCSCFQRLRVDVGIEGIRDSFDSIAGNRVTMSYGEFQLFSERFPAMFDCLYYRLVDHDEDRAHQSQVNHINDELLLSSRADEDARSDLLKEEQILSDLKDQLALTEQQHQEAVEIENTRKAAVEGAHTDLLSKRNRATDSHVEISQAKEAQSTWQGRLDVAQIETQAALASLRSAESDVRELQRELDRRIAEVDALKNTVRSCYDREGQISQEVNMASRRVQDMDRELQGVQSNVIDCDENERQTVAQYRESCDTSRQLAEVIESLALQMRVQKERVYQTTGMAEACAQRTRDLTHQLEAAETATVAYNTMRMNRCNEESDIINEEIYLQRQRRSLDDREARFRHKALSRSQSPHSPVNASSGYTPESVVRYDTVHYTPMSIQKEDRHMAPTPPTDASASWSKRTPNRDLSLRRSFDTTGRDESPRRLGLRSPPKGPFHNSSPGAFASSGYDNGRYPKPDTKRSTTDADKSAATLHKAMKGFGTDESAIYKVMESLKTRSEWLDIKASFKKNYPTFHKGDLVKALEDDLTKSEFEKCSKMMAKKGVSIRV